MSHTQTRMNDGMSRSGKFWQNLQNSLWSKESSLFFRVVLNWRIAKICFEDKVGQNPTWGSFKFKLDNVLQRSSLGCDAILFFLWKYKFNLYMAYLTIQSILFFSSWNLKKKVNFPESHNPWGEWVGSAVFSSSENLGKSHKRNFFGTFPIKLKLVDLVACQQIWYSSLREDVFLSTNLWRRAYINDHVVWQKDIYKGEEVQCSQERNCYNIERATLPLLSTISSVSASEHLRHKKSNCLVIQNSSIRRVH